MKFIEAKLQAFSFKNRNSYWVIFFVIIFPFFVFLKIIPAAQFNFDIWYPLDDAYISIISLC